MSVGFKKLTREHTARLATEFENATGLIKLEFRDKTNQEAYRLAFSRLLKADPLDRVLMMGTDQRDLFVPDLRKAIKKFPVGGNFFDVGGGNGDTFKLVENPFAEKGAHVSILEPDPHYAHTYATRIKNNPNLHLGSVCAQGLVTFEPAAQNVNAPIPEMASQDLVAGIHMLYFVPDAQYGMQQMYDMLKTGGQAFIVVADETTCYTGQAVRHVFTNMNQRVLADNNSNVAQKRKRLLVNDGENPNITNVLTDRFAKTYPTLQSNILESRLYGHTLGDVIALSCITMLAPSNDELFDLRKLDLVTEMLQQNPELVDLRIETDGIRAGMYSIAQHQIASVITKVPAHDL